MNRETQNFTVWPFFKGSIKISAAPAASLTRPCFRISAGQTAQLTAKPRVEARCGENVTLTCDVNISDPGRIKLFQWIAKDTTCEHGKDDAGAKIVCQSEEKRLSLTVLNVMPGDQGEFLCKLRSETGAKSTKTLLVTPSTYIRKRKLVKQLILGLTIFCFHTDKFN